MQLLSSWKLSVVLMINAALYYAFLAIFASTTPAVVVGTIATMVPFWAIYLLILLNTGVCLWRRIPALRREIGRAPLADHSRPRWRQPMPDDAGSAEAERLLRSMGYAAQPTESGGLCGSRRRFGVFGTFLFHGSFLLLATGFFLTFVYRAESKVAVAVGEQHSGAANFRVEAITPEFWKDRLLFTSLTADLTLDGGTHKEIRINRPLWMGWGSFLRLSNFGYAPVYELRDRRGRVIEQAVVKLAVFPPGKWDHFPLIGFPHRVYMEVYPDAELRQEEVSNKSLNLRDPVIAVRVTRGKLTVARSLARLGEPIEFEGMQLTIPEIRYYGEFAILRDSGAPFLFFGCLVGFVGLALRAGGRRADIVWTPGDDAKGGELLGYGSAEQPPDEQARARAPYGWWAIPGTVLTVAAISLWVARWVSAGHLPLFGTFESSLSLAAAVMTASWWWELRARFRSGAGPVATIAVLAILVHGYTFDRSAYALTISETSLVVDAHAVLAWAAFGVLTTNAALSLRLLLLRGAHSQRQAATVFRTLEIGFVLHTAMLISGALYKFMLFGKSWSFDPIETLGFLAWMSYGTLVHLVRFAHWDGRRLAGWALFLFVVLVVSYRIIVYYPSWSSYHILDMNLRMHLV